MIAVPAVDLRGGACVQLVGGDYADERVRLADPVAVAVRWADCGFARLHVVDLDAATGRGDNAGTVQAVLAGTSARVAVGGGVREAAQAAAWLAAGAAEVVVGTRAVEDSAWLAGLAARHPGRVTVAADVRGRRVVTRGWTADGGADVEAFVASLAGLPLGGLLVTAVEREGRLAGPDVELVASLAKTTALPLFASGGVSTLRDLERLQEAGAARAVLGMSLYTGALDPRAVAREFGS